MATAVERRICPLDQEECTEEKNRGCISRAQIASRKHPGFSFGLNGQACSSIKDQFPVPTNPTFDLHSYGHY